MKQLAWQGEDGNREMCFSITVSLFIDNLSNFLFWSMYWFIWWGPFYKFFESIDVALSWKRMDPFLQEHWPSETEHPQEYFIGLNPYGPWSYSVLPVISQCSSGEALDNNTVYRKHWRYLWKVQNLLMGFLKVQYVRPKFCLYKYQAKM